jgi:hypothetical protein
LLQLKFPPNLQSLLCVLSFVPAKKEFTLLEHPGLLILLQSLLCVFSVPVAVFKHVEKSVQSLVWLLALPKSTFVQVEVASQLSTAYTDCSNITELARATVLMNKEAIIVMTDIFEKNHAEDSYILL